MTEKDIIYDKAFKKNHSIMVRYCARKVGGYMAEDIASEAFMLLYIKWDALVSHDEKLITAWLYKVIDRKVMEYQRKNCGEKETVDWSDVEKTYADDTVDGLAEEKRYNLYMREIRQRLSKLEIGIFDCMIVNKMSVAETAEKLRISQVNVRVRLSRVRKRIEEFIEEIL